MRQTLRRSCAACAKSKAKCDLGSPQCSRCIKRHIQCAYANEPLTATLTSAERKAGQPSRHLQSLNIGRFASLDPFDSYPPTRLPREHVQRLIHTCTCFVHKSIHTDPLTTTVLTKIAFQYYPLDLNTTSNPFLVSWWPLALGDPALFHVSLQTACLDEELLAQKGFQTSEALMADSVTLLRRKLSNQTLAVQDGTMNSVITLAAIEFGKGNIVVSQMHVEGVKRMVDTRGGISGVRQTSPLTARMVSWVSMLITGHPQFETQNDLGTGDGIPSIPEWHLDLSTGNHHPLDLDDFLVDATVRNVFIRLHKVFERAQRTPISTTQLHDLTCYVIHRLLPTASNLQSLSSSPLTECMRYAIVLYMFITHGTTYYPHTFVLNRGLIQFKAHLEQLESSSQIHDSINVWLLTIGMVASTGTLHYQWYFERARIIATLLQLQSWDDVFIHIKSVLWLNTAQGEGAFRPHWDVVLATTVSPSLPEYIVNFP
ncbi:hypothetical protein D6D01_09909 [Aureobasidium pullulans]|uniref:Zn(2)-C6 fungal-type domain-containing protein n=1 Tax=Aureobasidium pullulans TaxID=5580 RepID=A0A4S9JVD5_AURPU|nr:hypothetical protein D6D01_09909 [Aureobasidium pullulans]